MNADEDSKFDEKVIASLRGELSSTEQESFVQLVREDPVKKKRSEQLALSYEFLSLCAAAESPPAKIRPATLDRLRETVTDLIYPPPPPPPISWYKKPPFVFIAAVIVLGAALLCFLLPSQAPRPAPPFVEYAMRRDTTSYLGFLGPTVAQSDDALKIALGGDRLTYLEDDTSLKDWENTWPPSDIRPAIKVLLLVHGDWKQVFARVFPTEIGQVKVTRRWQGSEFQKTFAVTQEAEWKEAIQKARQYMHQSAATGVGR
jgi:hypothetical protein